MLKNKPLLLAVLAILMLLKFVVQPWYTAQAEKLDELAVTSKRLSKVLALQYTEKPMLEELTLLKQQLSSLDQQLPVATTSKDMSLQVQNSWQDVFAAENVQVEMFNWVGEREVSAPGYHVGRVQLRLSGKLHQLMLATTLLQKKFPSASVEVSKVNQSSGLQMSSATELSLTIDFVYRLGES